MTIDDFAWLWHGIVQRPLLAEEAFLLRPISIHRGARRRALLLLHGFGSSPAVFRLILPVLETLYDGIEAPVLPGHAETPAALAAVEAVDWQQCAQQHCEHLLQQYDEVDVLGLSLGGVLACQLSQHFRLRHLYLLAPALVLNVPFNWGGLLPKCLLKIGIQSLPHQGGNLHSHQEAELVYRRLPTRALQTILQFIKDAQWAPPTCPTDVFLGRHDAVVNGFKIARLMKALPETTVHWLQDSAHVLPLDSDWRSIVRVVQRSQ